MKNVFMSLLVLLVTVTVHAENAETSTVQTPRTAPGQAPAYPTETTEERDARLAKMYQPLLGTYVGQVVFDKPNSETLKFSLVVYSKLQEGADRTMYPALLAYYQRADDPQGNIPLTFDVRIDRESTPETLVFESRPFPGPANSYKVKIVGSLKKDVLSGTFTDFFKARDGRMTLRKTK